MDLLIIEDNPTDRLVIETRLRRGFPHARLTVADDLRQLRENLKHENCDVVVTDYWLGWTDGLSVQTAILRNPPQSA